jgi:hypothetical protein
MTTYYQEHVNNNSVNQATQKFQSSYKNFSFFVFWNSAAEAICGSSEAESNSFFSHKKFSLNKTSQSFTHVSLEVSIENIPVEWQSPLKVKKFCLNRYTKVLHSNKIVQKFSYNNQNNFFRNSLQKNFSFWDILSVSYEIVYNPLSRLPFTIRNLWLLHNR